MVVSAQDGLDGPFSGGGSTVIQSVSVAEAVDAFEPVTEPGSLGRIRGVTAADTLDGGRQLAGGL